MCDPIHFLTFLTFFSTFSNVSSPINCSTLPSIFSRIPPSYGVASASTPRVVLGGDVLSVLEGSPLSVGWSNHFSSHLSDPRDSVLEKLEHLS